MSELENPKDDYSEHLRDSHAQNVSEYFESLVEQSGIDEAANAVTVGEYNALQAQVETSSKSRSNWRALRVWSIIIASLAGIVAVLAGGYYYLLLAVTAGALLLIFLKINPSVRDLHEVVARHEAARDAKAAEAWGQMSALNDLHTWGVPQMLFTQTLPEIQLNGYLTRERLDDLWENYGLSPEFNNGRSVLATQSGSYKDNPFAIAQFLHHWIGERTYWGYLTIYWTEQDRDSDGNWVTVQKSEQLSAWVSKPFPEFVNDSVVIYGHDAAPDLSFSRSPSNISDKEGKALENRVNRAVKKVERQARKGVKSGTGNLTVMANSEFEAIFHATDRDHETQFRLLFTVLTQQHMVELLKDKQVGYGDDFAFSKFGKVNFIQPQHLNELSIDDNPAQFKTFDAAEARRYFNEYNNEYFKSIFFGLAPLLTIPLYRDARPLGNPAPRGKSMDLCFWEHEALVNYLGEEHFRHPDSDTMTLLKTAAESLDEETAVVNVVAYGYEAFTYVDYVSVYGNDGNWHEVPVEWVHYEPVENHSQILVSAVMSLDAETGDEAWQDGIARWEQYLGENGYDSSDYVLWGNVAVTRIS